VTELTEGLGLRCGVAGAGAAAYKEIVAARRDCAHEQYKARRGNSAISRPFSPRPLRLCVKF
jgi:hypothetical protein